MDFWFRQSLSLAWSLAVFLWTSNFSGFFSYKNGIRYVKQVAEGLTQPCPKSWAALWQLCPGPFAWVGGGTPDVRGCCVSATFQNPGCLRLGMVTSGWSLRLFWRVGAAREQVVFLPKHAPTSWIASHLSCYYTCLPQLFALQMLPEIPTIASPFSSPIPRY